METLDKIQGRENKKTVIYNSRTSTEEVKVQTEYTEVNKPMKKSIKANKQKYMEELATTVGKATRKENMKQLYDTTKKLAGKYNKPERSVKDKEVKTVIGIREQKYR
ncbi:unnamed protein product [Schistosoma margrebowiei]|uniref:Uncharacterized protein n=1 Tax=Schistosoma margrebowiei TaxID=48269 RepID=A0A183N4U2_9TREM|nr:unnamed protein product [Schistosoma margrebowiei]